MIWKWYYTGTGDANRARCQQRTMYEHIIFYDAWCLRSHSNLCSYPAGIAAVLSARGSHMQHALRRRVRGRRCRRTDAAREHDLGSRLDAFDWRRDRPMSEPSLIPERSTRFRFPLPRPEHLQICRSERLQHQLLRWRCAVLRPLLCILFGSRMLLEWQRFCRSGPEPPRSLPVRDDRSCSLCRFGECRVTPRHR
jgi:hypothetical protein